MAWRPARKIHGSNGLMSDHTITRPTNSWSSFYCSVTGGTPTSPDDGFSFTSHHQVAADAIVFVTLRKGGPIAPGIGTSISLQIVIAFIVTNSLAVPGPQKPVFLLDTGVLSTTTEISNRQGSNFVSVWFCVHDLCWIPCHVRSVGPSFIPWADLPGAAALVDGAGCFPLGGDHVFSASRSEAQPGTAGRQAKIGCTDCTTGERCCLLWGNNLGQWLVVTIFCLWLS